MNWILEETIDSIEARIIALEKVINDTEVTANYKFAKKEEIKFLKDTLAEINSMINEEVEEMERAYEDAREQRAEAYM